MILEKTLEIIEQNYKSQDTEPAIISKVVIGLGYTGVEISTKGNDSFLGLAATIPSIIKNSDCSKMEFAGKLTDINIFDLLKWSLESPSIRKIVGLAALNACSQHLISLKNDYKKLEGDILKHLDINKDTRITVVGLMKPLVRNLGNITKSILLVEDSISVTPEFKEFKFIKRIEELNNEDSSTDILFCTGTALINDTIEKILGLFKEITRKIILIGPSASLIPDVLFENGVYIVGGMEILDSEATLRVLQEGGGTKLFKQYGKKYNLIKE
ncbi:MAG: Rossmann-like domain-containing protein [Candidatus Thorarchaeota archaeon]